MTILRPLACRRAVSDWRAPRLGQRQGHHEQRPPVLTVGGRDSTAVTLDDGAGDGERAVVSVGVSDPRGLVRQMTLDWNGREVPFVPGAEDVALYDAGVHAAAPIRDAGTVVLPFAFTLELNGTGSLQVLPSGNDTSVRLRSPWPHPSFGGAAGNANGRERRLRGGLAGAILRAGLQPVVGRRRRQTRGASSRHYRCAPSDQSLAWPLAVGTHDIEVRDRAGRRARTSVVVK